MNTYQAALQQAGSSRPRNATLDILRGLTMFIVVMAHAMQSSLLPGEESILWMRFIRPFQMPILFLISGWALAFSFPPRSHTTFLRKKTERLFIPYVAWLTIFYLLTLFSQGAAFSFAGYGMEILNSDFWFLRALFLIYVVVWMGAICCEKWGKGRQCFPWLAVSLGLVVILLLRKIDILRPTANGWFYQWFLTGYLVHIIWRKNRDKWGSFLIKHQRNIAIACSILLLIILGLVYRWDLSQNLVAYITIPGICFVVIGFESFIPRQLRILLQHWGNISLGIYAIHWCLFLGSGSLLAELYPDWPYSLRVLLLTVLWMLGCEILNYLFEKLKITRLLLLGKA